MSTEIIRVPDLGDTSDVEVIELLVSVGQAVAENDSLLVLESEKAAMEIPAPLSGVVKSIKVNLGDQVKTGSEILTLEVEGSSAVDQQQEAELEQQAEPEVEQQAATGSEKEKPASASKEKAKPTASAASPVLETVEVPDLGGENDVEIIEIHVAKGDRVEIDDPLITLESDKAAMEVPSAKAGEVKTLKVKIGDKVSMGSPILDLLTEPSVGRVEVKAATAATDAVAQTVKEPVTQTAEPKAPVAAAESLPVPVSSAADIYAGPAVRKLARELGVMLAQVSGTGAKGRILKEDIHQFVKSRLSGQAGPAGAGFATVPDIDFSQFGEIEQIPTSKLHKLTAANMQRNWSAIPHVAQFNEADVTELEAFRDQQKVEAEKKGVKLTFLPFLLKACANTLQEFPQFNVSMHSSGEYLIQKKYIHIGVAVATDAGLLVPVIRNVDQKSIWELAAELIEITDKAKQRKLTKQDMQGACFSISSLGAIGGTGFIPIINAPEVAILGVGKTDIKPVFHNGEFVPRKMLPLTLSYDHRAVNGVDGGLFSTHLVKLLGDIRLLVL